MRHIKQVKNDVSREMKKWIELNENKNTDY